MNFIFKRYLFQILASLFTSFVNLDKLFEVKIAQFCLILCNPMDYIVHGIL